jgi:ribose transport system substrate-binding protein
MRGVFALIALTGLVALSSCNKKENTSASSPSGQSGTLRIAVIPKGTTHEFWKSVHAGADQAGQELGVQITWKGPLQENDRAQQIQIVEQLISDNYNALVLAPLDDKALVKPVQEAAAKKIPVVIFDSAIKAEVGKDYVSFVATDNHKGGTIGGQELARLLGGKGKVVLLRYEEGSASTMEREAGFLEVMKQNPQIQMLVENRYAGATVDSAQNAAMNLLDQLRIADGVFCPNESSTRGMLLALGQGGLKGKLKFVGFDTTPQLVQSLRNDELQALVAQNPRKMGYEGVKAAVAAIKGQPLEQRIDTGVQLITKENLDTPEVKQLLGN